MIANLFNQSFEITLCPALRIFCKTLFASLLQYHEAMQHTYGMDHIIVKAVINSAVKFGVSFSELRKWGVTFREDFDMRNAARNRDDNNISNYIVNFNTVRCNS